MNDKELISEAREHLHYPGSPAYNWCMHCAEDWPCVTRRLADALEAATRERDAAVAAIERVRAAVSGHPECDRYEDGDVISCGWKSAYASVVAALDGAPEPEVEREYRRVRPDGVPVFNAVFETMPLLDDYYTAEYRTVSPWLPVEGES